MFEAHSEEIDRVAGASAVGACWGQWQALGSPASRSDGALASALVDPEALVVLSLFVRDRERRLLDIVRWWARVGSGLLSVQRFQAVAGRFPEAGGEEALRLFGSLAVAEGDRRWARHGGEEPEGGGRRDRGPDAPSLVEPCTIWLRLRAGFGVGAKADALAFLLTNGGAWSSVKEIAFATGYSTVTTRTAASEMTLARFVRETGTRPVEYAVPVDAWAPLLSLSRSADMPRWRFSSEAFAFLAGALEWARTVRSSDAPGPRVLASRARDLLEKHQRAFALDRIGIPRPDRYRGPEAADGLLETVRVVARWMETDL
jgi:hypothetical protein